jgi:hypothetical protein
MIAVKPTIRIVGVLRSGTNLVEFLLKNNFYTNIIVNEHGWKHGPIDKQYAHNLLIVTKNPYAWLISIFQYATKRKVLFQINDDISFDEFVLSPFNFEADVAGPGTPQVSIHTTTPLHYWNERYQEWLNHSTSRITSFVKYESILEDPPATLQSIQSKYQITQTTDDMLYPAEEIKPGRGGMKIRRDTTWNYLKRKYYVKSEYMRHYSESLLTKIRPILDKTLMQTLNYQTS